LISGEALTENSRLRRLALIIDGFILEISLYHRVRLERIWIVIFLLSDNSIVFEGDPFLIQHVINRFIFALHRAVFFIGAL